MKYFSTAMLEKLPTVKKRIALSLENYERDLGLPPLGIVNCTITEVATKIKTTPSMITKTLKALNFFGWKSFITYIMQTSIVPSIDNDFYLYLKNTLFRSVEATIKHIRQETINDIADWINSSKKIYFLFPDRWKYLAQWMSDKYCKLGKHASFINLSKMETALIDNESVVFLISDDEVETLNKHIDFIRSSTDARCVCLNHLVDKPIPNCTNVPVVKMFDNLEIDEKQFPRNNLIINQIILDYIFIKWFSKYELHISTVAKYLNLSHK